MVMEVEFKNMELEFASNEDWFDLGVSVVPNQTEYWKYKYTLRIGLAFWAIYFRFVKNPEYGNWE
jgi:hypothetical protein